MHLNTLLPQIKFLKHFLTFISFFTPKVAKIQFNHKGSTDAKSLKTAVLNHEVSNCHNYHSHKAEENISSNCILLHKCTLPMITVCSIMCTSMLMKVSKLMNSNCSKVPKKVNIFCFKKVPTYSSYTPGLANTWPGGPREKYWWALSHPNSFRNTI